MTLYFVSATGVMQVKGNNAASIARTLKTYGYRRVTKAAYLRKQRKTREADHGKTKRAA